LNAKNGEPVFGLSFYTDREGAELPYRGRKAGMPPHPVEAPLYETKLATPPKDVDWRLTKAVTAVKNQGQCGSCWAFSATEEVESQFILHVTDDYAINFSPQQVASCTTACEGCGGGWTHSAYDYLKSSKGLAPEAFWPYAQGLTPVHECSDPSCTESCSKKDLSELKQYSFYIGPHATVEGFTYATPACNTGSCDHQDLEKFAASLAETPVSVCVDASAWNDYTGGVMSAEACGPSGAMDLDHCVQAVGYNTTAAKPYWIVRNSWSEGWGESGYIYLEYGKNTCGLANEATIATVQTKPDGETPFARLFEQASGEKPVFKPKEVVV